MRLQTSVAFKASGSAIEVFMKLTLQQAHTLVQNNGQFDGRQYLALWQLRNGGLYALAPGEGAPVGLEYGDEFWTLERGGAPLPTVAKPTPVVRAVLAEPIPTPEPPPAVPSLMQKIKRVFTRKKQL